MRVDLYTFVHKAQRYHMFRLSEDMGLTDFSRSVDAEEIGQRVHNLIEHLKDHAQNEHKYIHPLYQAVGRIGEHFDHEHDQLEIEINTLERAVKQKQWNELYSIYTRFLGIYLLHLNEEEAAQRDILWKRYDDKDLAAVFTRFKAERPPHLAKDDFEYMLPALSAPELTQIFRGMKLSTPAHIYQGACDAAAKILSAEKWHQVVIALN